MKISEIHIGEEMTNYQGLHCQITRYDNNSDLTVRFDNGVEVGCMPCGEFYLYKSTPEGGHGGTGAVPRERETTYYIEERETTRHEWSFAVCRYVNRGEKPESIKMLLDGNRNEK